MHALSWHGENAGASAGWLTRMCRVVVRRWLLLPPVEYAEGLATSRMGDIPLNLTAGLILGCELQREQETPACMPVAAHVISCSAPGTVSWCCKLTCCLLK